MSKRDYLRLCERQPLYWLERCVVDPGPYMKPIHVALIRLAIRRKLAVAR